MAEIFKCESGPIGPKLGPIDVGGS